MAERKFKAANEQVEAVLKNDVKIEIVRQANKASTKRKKKKEVEWVIIN